MNRWENRLAATEADVGGLIGANHVGSHSNVPGAVARFVSVHARVAPSVFFPFPAPHGHGAFANVATAGVVEVTGVVAVGASRRCAQPSATGQSLFA